MGPRELGQCGFRKKRSGAFEWSITELRLISPLAPAVEKHSPPIGSCQLAMAEPISPFYKRAVLIGSVVHFTSAPF